MKDWAIVSTLDSRVHVVEGRTWGDALAQFLSDHDLERWESLLGSREADPREMWTVDLYAADGSDLTVVLLALEDLEVDDPHSLPVNPSA